MPIHESYTRRKREKSGDHPDVYKYDEIPEKVRTQIRFILEGSIGSYDKYEGDGFDGMSAPPNNNTAWTFIRDGVCRELGRLSLAKQSNAKDDCIHFIQMHPDIDEVLELVQFAFKYIDDNLRTLDSDGRKELGIKQDPDDAIAELNVRFLEAGVGYSFGTGLIMRVDSQLVHAEVVKPALILLSDSRFKGAEDEFLSAHAHYRAGEHKAATIDALKAFESTMKTICDIQKWKYKKGARASDLIKVVKSNRLFPDYLDGSFDQLIATLKSGLPAVRNEEGGHGQGSEPKHTPGYLAAYALHLSAADIVLLVEALRAIE